jgi:hypothetical protein
MKIEVREIKPVEPPKEYVLTFDQNELDVVVACLGKTGGYDGEQGWRPILNKIYEAVYRHAKVKDGILNRTNGQFPSDRKRIVPEV